MFESFFFFFLGVGVGLLHSPLCLLSYVDSGSFLVRLLSLMLLVVAIGKSFGWNFCISFVRFFFPLNFGSQLVYL